MSIRVATDIGGTFTDVAYAENGEIHWMKVPSTPKHPDRAVVEVIASLPPISSFSHGTTVATNALLERKGARVALLVTEGFRDILHIARQRRPRLYDFSCERPKPLVEQRFYFEVPERLAYDGSVLQPLSFEDAEALAERIGQAEADAVAICLLFSFKNPVHELLLEKVLKKRKIPVSRSSNIIPEFREYERASTTAINAFIQPVVGKYIKRIGQALQGSMGMRNFYVMKSNGGVEVANQVSPVELLLSGPAGGVAAGMLLGQEMSIPNIVTFDMGGTSADFSAICDHASLWTDEGEIDGLPISIPILDITTVGAGGGSIAWIDKGGALRVGPQSAGAEPGPVCYDRGGVDPTVTDVNLLAGLINPQSFKKAGITPSTELAEDALKRFSKAIKLDFKEAILGIRSVVNATMLRGIRKTTMEKGIDVRSFSLLAFGGAGPLHAADIARELDMKEVIVPPLAGVFSALGILLSDIKLSFTQTLLIPWVEDTRWEIERVLKRLYKKAQNSLKKQGIGKDKALFSPVIDMRFKGQGFHLSIPYSKDAEIEENFRRVFNARYGYKLPAEQPLELVNVKLLAIGLREARSLPGFSFTGHHEPLIYKRILQPSGWSDVQVYLRATLAPDFSAQGPIIIEDEGSTIFVPSDFSLYVHENGSIRMQREV